jgi:DNA ligase-1
VEVRRSLRNVGKDTLNYNIDEILDAADQINNGSVGGACIQMMLA